MFEFIEDFFNSFFRKSKDDDSEGGFIRAGGAFENTPDNRDILLSSVQKTVSDVPDEYDTDLSMISVIDQLYLGICVACAFTVYKMWLDFKETGKVTKYSLRIFYTLVRQFSKMREIDGQGLYPRQAAKVAVNIGFVKDKGIDDQTLPHETYCVIPKLTDEDMKQADETRALGYAFVDEDPESLVQAIFTKGLVMISLPTDVGMTKWKKGFVRLLKKFGFVSSRHYVLIKGFTRIKKKGVVSDYEFRFRNSWGVAWGFKGDGKLLWSEFQELARDLMVLTDMPNDVLKRAKDSRFIFLRDLKMGSSGEDVSKLQEYLSKAGLFEEDVHAYFGFGTQQAVIQYQRLHNLPETGFFGPMTREVINKENNVPMKQSSKIDLWCEAIKEHEGWYVPQKNSLYPNGSKSFRNNNPGNLRYIGQKESKVVKMGEFCVFPDYATGYMVLRRMLVNACTGKSKVYSPSMSLLDFFKKYAPSEDNNNPVNYANTVAKKLGVPVTIKISELV